MDLGTKDIIKILPFDESFKHEILLKFDSLTPDEKYTIERIVWDLYDTIYSLKLQAKIDMALTPDAVKQIPLNKEFYKTVKKEVDEEMLSESLQSVEKVDLQATRDKLQEILKTPQE